MSDNNTLDYYNQHTADFVNTTQNVDFHEIQELFLSFLPAKAKILDFGCGSGRDTKYFIDNGYEVDAMDYVVKPVEYFSFSQKLDKAIGRIRSEAKEFLMITIGEGIVKTDIADIYFIEGQGHNAVFHTLRGDYSSRVTLKELEEKLIVHNFFRCAKGYLVNMNHVEGIVGSDCVIHSVHIPVSRTRKKEFMNKLLQNLNMD